RHFEVRGHRRLGLVEVEDDLSAVLGGALLSLEVAEREAQIFEAGIARDVPEREIEHAEVADSGATFDTGASVRAVHPAVQRKDGAVPGEGPDVPAQSREAERVGSGGEIEAQPGIEVERSVHGDTRTGHVEHGAGKRDAARVERDTGGEVRPRRLEHALRRSLAAVI